MYSLESSLFCTQDIIFTHTPNGDTVDFVSKRKRAGWMEFMGEITEIWILYRNAKENDYANAVEISGSPRRMQKEGELLIRILSLGQLQYAQIPTALADRWNWKNIYCTKMKVQYENNETKLIHSSRTIRSQTYPWMFWCIKATRWSQHRKCNQCT